LRPTPSGCKVFEVLKRFCKFGNKRPKFDYQRHRPKTDPTFSNLLTNGRRKNFDSTLLNVDSNPLQKILTQLLATRARDRKGAIEIEIGISTDNFGKYKNCFPCFKFQTALCRFFFRMETYTFREIEKKHV